MKHKQYGFGHLWIFVVLVVAVVGFAGWRVYKNQHPGNKDQMVTAKTSTGETVTYDKTASQALTDGRCSGAGPVKIGPPMPLDQVSFILPYGLVTGSHVTPVDHQYYNGLLANNSLRDTYDVIAPADGTLESISHRGDKVNTPPHTVDVPSSDEYRLKIVHTCSFVTTLDLMTSLSDNIKAQLPKNFDPIKGWDGQIQVKKGELLGHIGGQTLDVFVWDLSHKLTGYVNYNAYNDGEWRQYIAPVSDYLDPAIKSQVIAKYVRTAAPIDGKIDYDIDGKLIGNWFQVGTNGYLGGATAGEPNYWKGHLSIAPDFIDPSQFNVSIGDYYSYPGTQPDKNGLGAEQFMAIEGSANPATVGQSSGLVKYELVQKSYYLPNGQSWDNMSFATGLRAKSNGYILATALAQLTGKQELKFEVFPGKSAAQVSGFDNNAKMYDRGQDAKSMPSTQTN